MIKSVFAAAAAAPLFAGAAFAGPYVNIEANSGFAGSDYSGTTTDFHVGFEGTEGAAAWYIQGGPALSFPDDGEQTGAASGKVGIGVDVTKRLNAYGEVSAITSEGLETEGMGVGFKTGLKYSF